MGLKGLKFSSLQNHVILYLSFTEENDETLEAKINTNTNKIKTMNIWLFCDSVTFT